MRAFFPQPFLRPLRLSLVKRASPLWRFSSLVSAFYPFGVPNISRFLQPILLAVWPTLTFYSCCFSSFGFFAAASSLLCVFVFFLLLFLFFIALSKSICRINLEVHAVLVYNQGLAKGGIRLLTGHQTRLLMGSQRLCLFSIGGTKTGRSWSGSSTTRYPSEEGDFCRPPALHLCGVGQRQWTILCFRPLRPTIPRICTVHTSSTTIACLKYTYLVIIGNRAGKAHKSENSHAHKNPSYANKIDCLLCRCCVVISFAIARTLSIKYRLMLCWTF